MKQVILFLFLVLFAASSMFGGVSAPSPFLFNSSGQIINIIPSLTSPGGVVISLVNIYTGDTTSVVMGTSVSTIYNGSFVLANLFWSEKVITDTLWLSTTGVFRTRSGEFIHDFTGDGLYVDGAGALRVNLGTTISRAELDTDIIGRLQLDSNGIFVVTGMFKGISTVADSAFTTINYVSKYIAGLDVVGSPADGQVPTFETASGDIIWATPSGGGAGTTVSLDTNSTTALGEWSPATMVLKFIGATVEKTSVGDTANITIVGANSVLKSGSTMDASSTFDWNQALMGGIDSLYADTIATKYLFAGDSIKTTILKAAAIRPYDGSYLNFGMPPSSGGSINFFRDTSSTNVAWRFNHDTLSGGATKGVIREIQRATFDSLFIDTAMITLTGGVPNWVSRVYLTTQLGNYVSSVNENWRDITGRQDSIAYVVSFSGVPYNVITARGTLAGDDTSNIIGNGILTLSGTSPSATSNLFEGLTYFKSGLRSGVAANNTQLDSVRLIADTIRARVGLQLIPAVLISNLVTLKAASDQPAAQTWTLPKVDLPLVSGGYVRTDGNGVFSVVTVAPGGSTGGYPLSVNTSSVPNTVDSAIIIGQNGILTSIVQGVGLTPDRIYIEAEGLTAAMFLNTAQITTESETNDSLMSRFASFQPWRSTRLGTTYGAGNGRDSVYFLGVDGLRALEFIVTATGPDSTSILGPSAGGLIMGRPGITILDGDSTLIVRKIKFGNSIAAANSTWLDSLRLDSMIELRGRYASGGAGSGDITDVGTMTDGVAFNSSAASNQSLGLGATAGRIQFKANGSGGTRDDIVRIPLGAFGIGIDSSGANDFSLVKDTAALVRVQIANRSTSSNAGVELGLWSYLSGTGGKSVLRWYTDDVPDVTMGINQMDSAAFIFERNGAAGSPFGTVGNYVFQIDSNGTFVWQPGGTDYGAFKGVRNVADSAIFNTLKSIKTIAADSALKYVHDTSVAIRSVLSVAINDSLRNRKPLTQEIRGGDLKWSYPVSDALGNDSTCRVSFPYMTHDESYDSTFLFRCSTIASGDTAFVMLEVPFDDSVSVDSVILYGYSSSTTYSNVGLDSMHCTKQVATGLGSTAITAVADWGTVDWASASSTVPERRAIDLSNASVPFGTGDKLKILLRFALHSSNSFFTIMKAQVVGSQQR